MNRLKRRKNYKPADELSLSDKILLGTGERCTIKTLVEGGGQVFVSFVLPSGSVSGAAYGRRERVRVR